MSTVIVGYARTPFAKFNGALQSLSAAALGARAAAAALALAGVEPEQVDRVVAGQVILAGAGQNPARQAAIGTGVPKTVPSLTVNSVCLSGAEAVVQASRLIAGGEAKVVLAIGQESMSQAPHAIMGSRAGKKYGALEVIDTLEYDALTDAFEKRSMGASTEEFNGKLGLSREAQDEYAVSSHQRAAAAAGVLAGEIEPVIVKEGQPAVAADDGVRADTTLESLAKLRPAFAKDGTITAGNASQITDGAAALVLVDEEVAKQLGLTPIARVVGWGHVAGPDYSLHSQPSRAIQAAMERLGRPVSDLAAIEINEAFASVALQSMKDLEVDPAIVNANGGAIALGHPVGASGARLVGHLARRLEASGAGSIGAAALCGGGGQGLAVVLERL